MRPGMAARRLVGLLLLALLSGCGAGGPAYGPAAPGTAATVEMTSTLDFAPAEVTVRAGDTVEWRNRSLLTHTVTADPAKANEPGRVGVPQGAETFDSGSVPPGRVFRQTFTTPGVYRYVCLPHEDMGMQGTVTVQPR